MCIRDRVTSEEGESFLDKMIAMVEGASRKKTPNEIALEKMCIRDSLIIGASGGASRAKG